VLPQLPQSNLKKAGGGRQEAAGGSKRQENRGEQRRTEENRVGVSPVQPGKEYVGGGRRQEEYLSNDAAIASEVSGDESEPVPVQRAVSGLEHHLPSPITLL